MAVLIEAISVVVRRDAIDARLRGGWAAFVAAVPNRTLCTDGKLARVGFMTPTDARSFVEGLEASGLVFRDADGPRDIVVVDQPTGPTAPCPWGEFDRASVPGGAVATFRLAGGTRELATPAGWSFEKSLSREHGFVASGDETARLAFVGRENGLDVYRDAASGKLVYVGRTDRRGPNDRPTEG